MLQEDEEAASSKKVSIVSIVISFFGLRSGVLHIQLVKP